MASPLAPWTRAMLDVLADGQWHARAYVLDLGAAAVPPGRAHRQGEADRTRKRAAPGPRVRNDAATSIAAGAHRIARKTLDGLAGVERDGDMVRRRP